MKMTALNAKAKRVGKALLISTTTVAILTMITLATNGALVLDPIFVLVSFVIIFILEYIAGD